MDEGKSYFYHMILGSHPPHHPKQQLKLSPGISLMTKDKVFLSILDYIPSMKINQL